MKINYNLPELSDIFKHDAPLYQIIKIAVPVFILISSLTVFSGVKLHISDYLQNYSTWITTPAFGFAYFLLSLAPDVLNSILVAYLIRSLLNKNKQRTDIILNSFALLLVIFLTRYSYNMSHFSAGSVSQEIGQEIEQIDLSEINGSYKEEKAEIQKIYKDDLSTIESNHKAALEALNAETEASIKPLRNKIQKLEKNRTIKNTQWTDREIGKLDVAINDHLAAQATEVTKFLKEKEQKTADLKQTRDSDLTKLNTDKETDRDLSKSLKEKSNEQAAQANGFLKSELEKIAGFAIFIVLVLVSLKEIIHFRNDIKPQPIIAKLDFQFDWINEVLSFPGEAIKRYSVNAIRKKYAELPPLHEPQEVPKLEQYVQEQEIVKILPAASDFIEEDFTFFRGGKSQKSGVPFIAHEKHTKNTEMKAKSGTRKTHVETAEMREARQRLKQYKKHLGSHRQKARLQKKKDGFINPRTQKAIDNNLAWVNHYKDILNGGTGTRK